MFHVKQKRVAFRSPAGACLLCRLLTLPFVYLLTPIPPTPLPGGKGEIFVLFCRGLAPPASLRLSPRGIGFFCRGSAFLPPSPRPPSRREGGAFWFSYARGSAPCIPGAEPGRHWLNRGGWRPRHPLRLSPGGTGYFLPRQCFLPPSPRPPSPVGKGELFGLFCRGLAPPAPLLLNLRGAGLPEGSAPCIPGAEPARCWLNRGAGAPPAPLRLSPRGAGLPGGSAPAPLRLSPGGAGYTFGAQAHKYYQSILLSEMPLSMHIYESSGGFGGLFQESPDVSFPQKVGIRGGESFEMLLQRKGKCGIL